MRDRSRTELGLLMRELLGDLERVRPGLPERASVEELRVLLGVRASERLGELYRLRCFAGEADADAAVLLAFYRREMIQIFLPRYARLAHRQNFIERHLAKAKLRDRLVHALRFFIAGTVLVMLPFAVLHASWLPFALAAVAPRMGLWLSRCNATATYQRALRQLHRDLDAAGADLGLLAAEHGKSLPAALPGVLLAERAGRLD